VLWNNKKEIEAEGLESTLTVSTLTCIGKVQPIQKADVGQN
jgi:hypothetical protein